MKAIHQAILKKQLNAKLKLVICDNPQAGGLEYTRQQEIPSLVMKKDPQESRNLFDQRLIKIIKGSSADLIVLAGYMRLLSSEFVTSFANKIVNIHPSLLPSFPGLHAQRQALEAGVRYSGCTVHFVDEGCDSGPIIDQRVVPVLADDDEEKLSARILIEEHQLYSYCLQKISEGKVQLKGRKVVLS